MFGEQIKKNLLEFNVSSDRIETKEWGRISNHPLINVAITGEIWY